MGLIQAVRTYLRARAGTAMGGALVGVAGAVLVLAWLLAGPEGWRPGTPVPLLLLVLAVAALAALAGWVFVRLRRWSSEPRLAQEMERSARLPEGSVRAQVELSRSVPPGVSPSLARAGEISLLSRLSDDPAHLGGGPARELVRLRRLTVRGGATLAAVAAVLLLLAPARARTAWAGLAKPLTLLSPEPLPPLDLSPGNAEVPRGEAPAVEVRAEGRDSVTVHWQAVGDVPQDRRLAVVDGKGETHLPGLEVEVRYWASSADGARTPVYSLLPSDPSLLSDLLIEIAYPPHTRLPPETFRIAPTELSIPEGTELRLSGSVEGRGADVLLRDEEGEVAARLAVEDGRFEGRWRPRRTARVEWVLEGGQEGGQLPPPLELEVVADEAPALALPVPGGDMDLPLSLRVPLLVDASDDYGVSWVEVETELHRGSEVEAPVVDRIPTGDLPRVMLRPVLDFTEWGLLPGNQILLKVRASDNAPAAHVVETTSYRLTMPGSTEVRDSARARIQETASRSEELLEKIEEQTAAIRDLERRNQFGASRNGGSSDDTDAYQDREDLLQALDRQADLAEELDEIRSGLQEAGQALSEMARDDPADAELSERIQELEQLLEDVLGPDARERLDELVEELTAGTMPDDPSDLLDEMAARQEQLQSQLEQALNELRESAIQEAFRGVEEEIQDLASTQEELVQELAQGRGQDREIEQAERTGDLQERLADLQRELSNSSRDPADAGPNDADPNAGDETSAAQEELGDAKEAMTNAAESSQSGDRQEAQQQATDAQSSLENALQQLEETRSQRAENAENGWRDALRQSAQDALSLARRQSELREAIRRSRPGARQQFEDDEVAVLEGLRNLQRELGDATSQVPDLGEILSEEMQRSLDAAERTVDGLRGTSGPQPDPGVFADSAQASMNRLALGALQQTAGGEPPQPGDQAEGSSQDLASVGSQQQALNEQAQQLSRQSSPSGAPSQMEMEDLVAGQQGVAAVLREMARLPGPGQPRSTLDALADESEQIAEELQQGRLDATTLGRQDQLLQRLLSAGRTLERDGPTDEREATAAKPTPRRAVTALPEEILDPLAFPLPSAEELERLSPGQRALVLEYFDRVNRRRASGDAR
jgi:hypothetical protein